MPLNDKGLWTYIRMGLKTYVLKRSRL